MKIEDIKPYEKNARYNEKAIPYVAESIKEFGLKGQIVLESRENPVIVAGHTRVAACKLLGWTEIPDERIDYCEDLTPEQIKAYRLADNKTAEIATWNKTLLQHEIKKIPTIDMGKFGFDFKSKYRRYGDEALRTDRAYNLDIVNISHCDGEEGYPVVYAEDFTPDDLIPFNYAKSAKSFDCGVCFSIDDYQFERVWNRPGDYIDLLSQFQCVITPEFSTYFDMPIPMRKWNVYRARALANYWQRCGLTVIPNPAWADMETIDEYIDGLPKHSTIYKSTVGVQRDKAARERFVYGLQHCIDVLEPTRILLYGEKIDFDFGDIETVWYTHKVFSKR